ncbi:sodium channel protein para-like protein [Dinothrombium tinctorium]|uniref:Sodium channel protein n=1 Tax=Dinothrombium tinctorium TaxID=1965070 RepID=A0A3S3QBT4_9ACAR|nr:sodium channel protein para-like protein [Dinothrombium tinctorium]
MPDPWLEAGLPLPRYLERHFPEILTATPIEEIDDYYKDTGTPTFVVISKGRDIWRFSTTSSLFIFDPFHPLRRVAIYMLVHPWFSFFVIVTILVNCSIMTLPSNKTIEKTEIIFTTIYTFESCLKIIARGFIINQFTYLRDPWNWLDFAVIVLAYMTMFATEIGNLSALRTFRVLRALKTVAIIPGMKTIVAAVIDSVKNLKDVIILTLFSLSVFALLGLQLYMGTLTQVCIMNGPVNMTDIEWYIWNSNRSNWINPDGEEQQRLCSNSTEGQMCKNESATCLAGFGDNPNYGYTNFDTFYYALLSAFRLMTQDAWELLYQMILRANGSTQIWFFMLAIFLGSIYLLNLILAIVAMSYNELRKRANAEETAVAAEEAAYQESQKLIEISAANENLKAQAFIENQIHSVSETPKSNRNSKKLTKAASIGWHENNVINDAKFEKDDSFSLPDPSVNEKGIFNTNMHEMNRKNTENSENSDYTAESSRLSFKNLEKNFMSQRRRSVILLHGLYSSNEALDDIFKWPKDNENPFTKQYDYEINFEEKKKFKEILIRKVNQTIDFFCIWDCCWGFVWIQKLFSNIVFDPFMELFITLCIVINTLFMAMDHHEMPHALSVALDTGNTKAFEGISGFSVLRTFRLVSRKLRVFKLAKSWPTLNLLISIMAKTMGSLGNLTFVLCIIMFIFAVMGNQLFGKAYENQPCKFTDCSDHRWHFKDFVHSFMIVFRILCGEWIELMWDCMHISGWPCIPFFLATVIIGNLVVLRLFLALLLSSFGAANLSAPAAENSDTKKLQEAFDRFSRAYKWLKNKFCSFLKRIFRSRNRVADVSSNQNQINNAVIAVIPEGKKFEVVVDHIEDGITQQPRFHFHSIANSILQSVKLRQALQHAQLENLKAQEASSIHSNMSTADQVYEADRTSEEIKAENIETASTDVFNEYPNDCFPERFYVRFPYFNQDTPFLQKWKDFRYNAYFLVESKTFETVVIILILISSMTLALEDIYLKQRPWLEKTLFYVDKIFTGIFFCEMVLKWIAYGFKYYFTNGWCWLDFIIVMVSVINATAELLGIFKIQAFKTMKTLRALRPLRAMSRMQGMRVVVNALIQAIPAIFNVLLVCLILWLIFAIMGVQFFSGKFAYCRDIHNHSRFFDTEVRNRDECLFANNTEWYNPPINFDNVLNGYLALLQVKKKVGGAIELLMTKEQKKYYNAMKKMGKRKPIKAIPRPRFKLQAFLFDMTTNKTFDMTIMAFIMLNMFVMCLDVYKASASYSSTLEKLNLAFIAIFTLECILKLFAFRWHFFKEPWNVFDFVIVMLSITGTILKEWADKYFVSPTLLRVVRVVKIGRVLRLVKGARGIRTLLFALAMSLPALFNICLLLFLIIFIYAIFGMSFFMNVQKRAFIDDMFNFGTFFKSFVVLFPLCTSGGWEGVLDAIMNEEDCRKPSEDNPGDCGNKGLAIGYLVSYLIITFFVIINMYIAVILENYSQAKDDVQQGLTNDDYDMFYEVWQKFDPKGTRFIHVSKLSDLLDALEEPLKIPKPNKYKIVLMDIPICEGDLCYCVEILDALTKEFFAKKGTGVEETSKLVPLYEDREHISSTMWRQRENYCAIVIQNACKSYLKRKHEFST